MKRGLASCWGQHLRVGEALTELGGQQADWEASAEPSFKVLLV